MRDRNPSPLRYPGGKASLSSLLEAVLYANCLQGSVYVEPFAGGAGAGIKLLLGGHVDRIIINDVDRAVFSFWRAVKRNTGDFIGRIMSTPLTVDEWRRQKDIYLAKRRGHYLDLGFAAFYLNRCNRSGIIMDAGPIGGMEQKGEWKIDARFNREALATRVERIAAFGDRVQVTRQDARSLIKKLPEIIDGDECFVYADPPYYNKAHDLYLNSYQDADHMAFAATMRRTEVNWVMTYDNVPRIKEIYKGMNIRPFALRYSAHHSSAEGGEILISPDEIVIPEQAVRLLDQAVGYLRRHKEGTATVPLVQNLELWPTS